MLIGNNRPQPTSEGGGRYKNRVKNRQDLDRILVKPGICSGSCGLLGLWGLFVDHLPAVCGQTARLVQRAPSRSLRSARPNGQELHLQFKRGSWKKATQSGLAMYSTSPLRLQGHVASRGKRIIVIGWG